MQMDDRVHPRMAQRAQLQEGGVGKLEIGKVIEAGGVIWNLRLHLISTTSVPKLKKFPEPSPKK